MIESFQLLLNNVLRTAVVMGLFLIALWIIYFVDSTLIHGALKTRFGVRPHAKFCPLCILFAPFLHVNKAHLMANSIPFFVLGALVMVQGQVAFWLTTAVIVVISGLGVWGFGKPNTVHMGARGLILGYFGYTLASIFFAPDLATIIVAIVVAVFYIGLITQVVPTKEGVSTTGHLFGFLGGILAAVIGGLLLTPPV